MSDDNKIIPFDGVMKNPTPYFFKYGLNFKTKAFLTKFYEGILYDEYIEKVHGVLENKNLSEHLKDKTNRQRLLAEITDVFESDAGKTRITIHFNLAEMHLPPLMV